MSDQKPSPSQEEAWLRTQLQDAQADSDGPSTTHDAAILREARAAGAARRSPAGQSPHSRKPPRKRGWWPVSLAASLVLGILIGRGSSMIQVPPTPSTALTIPTQTMARGQNAAAAGQALPVEQADPAVWYRYIQELIFSGQVELAEAHLRRFRELHPDFVYQP
ncbi:MAG TPA: hypothetical protein VF764_02060 [Steroidobacteraceae bacterium]